MAFEFFLKKSGITCPFIRSLSIDLSNFLKIVHLYSSLFGDFNKGSQKIFF